MVERAREFGGLILEAETLEEMGSLLSDHGVNGDRAIETVSTFNEHVSAECGARLAPPRKESQEPIDEPPFYAIDVRSGLTFTIGGLDVNHNAEVLHRASSTTTLVDSVSHHEHHFYEPIKGLYAAGVEIGNPDPGFFAAGGLSLALVSGRIAGKHAAERSKKQKIST